MIRAKMEEPLGATLAVMIMGAVTSGGDPTRCEQTYLASGPK
jgi:hypothetical protein